MLTLILGRAGSGKTSYILEKLAGLAREERAGNILIVPEQYSHDSERALAACGDSISLYCEVLSFSRLAARVFAETGGMAEATLDNGGRMLAMSLAASGVAQQLKVYNVGGRRPDFLADLIGAYDELRAAGSDALSIQKISSELDGPLARKLADLALIFEAYEMVKERSGVDARDRMERLADDIGRSSIGDAGRIFVDGFTDFTAQEFRVITELLKKGADVTVCLNCGRLDDRELLFHMPVRTAHQLLAAASGLGVKAEIINFRADICIRAPALRYLERNLLDYAAPPFEGESDAIEIYSAANAAEECSVAAARVLELVREGCRFRDIAVVSPSWDRYAGIFEGVFLKYGIPFSKTEKSDILEKPVMAVILSALDIISNNWDHADVLRYLKTGLAGVDAGERDILENYVLKWKIRGESAWTRAGGWQMHPNGYSERISPAEAEELELVNRLRAKVAEPVVRLRRMLEREDSALSKVRAVYGFMEDIGLFASLNEKAEHLMAAGHGELAEEYSQLWDIVVGALQQFADILGDSAVDSEEFIRLLRLVLSQYKVGVIPAYVDGVRAGDMSRIRARGIKHLIVLGATDDALPKKAGDSGIFSDAERNLLRESGVEFVDSEEELLARELGGIYASLTVPSETLTVTYPSASRRSYVVARLEKLFALRERVPDDEIYTAAKAPCFELAASSSGAAAQAARRYFEEAEEWRGLLEKVRLAASMPRGRLSRSTVERLYGREIRLSASQVDKYYSCRFAYFLQYGLRVKPRREAALDAPEAGTFMHFVLERAANEIERTGGFGAATPERVRAIVPDIVREYAEKKLGGMENKSGRFKYLYRRLAESAVQVVMSMCEELRNSDFTPLDFELRFAPDSGLPMVGIGEGDGHVDLTGAVDRVDGWVRGGKLYLRVVDYKTGKKAMSLSDIWHGMGMQMLIYLFALERVGGVRYGREIVPAGVLYAPARDVITRAEHDLSDEELEEERQKNLRRSGLLLWDEEVLEAMEHRGGDTKVLPVRFAKDGAPSGESLATAEQLGKLAKTVDRLISGMGRELRSGSAAADPYFRGQMDNACLYCDYFEACHFKDGTNGESVRYLKKLKTPDVWRKIEEAAEWER